MDKESLEKKIKELEELQVRIKTKQKEVDSELTGLRYQLCDILEVEESNKPPLDMSFLDNDPGWSSFG